MLEEKIKEEQQLQIPCSKCGTLVTKTVDCSFCMKGFCLRCYKEHTKDEDYSKEKEGWEKNHPSGLGIWYQEYDKSPKLREEHDRYMEEYRTCLSEICKVSNKNPSVPSKSIVSEYVQRTVGQGCKENPRKVLEELKIKYNLKN